MGSQKSGKGATKGRHKLKKHTQQQVELNQSQEEMKREGIDPCRANTQSHGWQTDNTGPASGTYARDTTQKGFGRAATWTA